jgi:hypothetical protein
MEHPPCLFQLLNSALTFLHWDTQRCLEYELTHLVLQLEDLSTSLTGHQSHEGKMGPQWWMYFLFTIPGFQLCFCGGKGASPKRWHFASARRILGSRWNEVW